MSKHVHCELIKAWAEGAEIEFNDTQGRWVITENPAWKPELEYRVKPRIVKREGWVNIYPINIDPKYMAETGFVFDSYNTAIVNCRNKTKIATVKIEWEEEQ